MNRTQRSILFAFVLFLFAGSGLVIAASAADAPLKPPTPKLTQEQIAQANQYAASAQIADLQKQLAEARQTISQQAQQLLIYRACWAANIPEKSCEVQPDGSLVKPAPPLKPPEPKK